MKQILFFDWLPERTSLRHRRNVTLVKSVCETAPQSMLWASICVPGFGYAPWMACSAGSKPWDNGEVRSSRPLDKRRGWGPVSQKNFVWSKNKGGGRAPRVLPLDPSQACWKSHCRFTDQAERKFEKHYPVCRRPRTRISALFHRRY